MKHLLDNLRKVLLPPEKVRFLGLVLLLSFGAVLELAGIGAVLPLIAMFVKPAMLESSALIRGIRAVFGNPPDRTFMVLLSGGTILCFVIKNILLYRITAVQNNFSFSVAGRAARTMLEKYISAPLVFHRKRDTGEVLELIKETRNTFAEILTSMIMLLSESLVIGAILIGSFAVAPVLTLCLMAVLGVFSLLMSRIVKFMLAQAAKKIFVMSSDISRFIMTAMASLREIKLSGRPDSFIKRGGEMQQALCKTDALMFTRQQLPRFSIEAGAVVIGVGTMIVMSLCGVPFESIALKISFLGIAMVRMLPSFSRIHYYMARYRGKQDIFNRICDDLIHVFPEELPVSTEKPLSLKKELRFENLSFRYGDKVILDKLNLALPAGGSLALIGPTGCGKSTLLDLIAGLMEPDSGRITADGTDIRQDLRTWRKKTGYVPQAVVLADVSVAENVAFGVPENQIDRKRVTECLQIAQALEFAAALPQGIDTPVGENGSRLSGGQRQRIGIARALYPNPEILLFDEATSALDTETEAAFVRALEALSGRVTTIIAAHRLSTIEKCTVKYTFK